MKTNQVILVAQDDKFSVYTNGVRQGIFFGNNKQRIDGTSGFVGFQDSGKGDGNFGNSWICELK